MSNRYRSVYYFLSAKGINLYHNHCYQGDSISSNGSILQFQYRFAVGNPSHEPRHGDRYSSFRKTQRLLALSETSVQRPKLAFSVDCRRLVSQLCNQLSVTNYTFIIHVINRTVVLHNSPWRIFTVGYVMFACELWLHFVIFKDTLHCKLMIVPCYFAALFSGNESPTDIFMLNHVTCTRPCMVMLVIAQLD